MKMFKAFKVNVSGLPQVVKAMEEHAESLGYTDLGDGESFNDLFCLGQEGEFSEAVLGSQMDIDAKEISIREFFKLTPEDVVIEPERWRCSFDMGLAPPKWAESKVFKSFLTRDQIDRIKSIMDEES